MDQYTATEVAYKNGFEAGKQEAYKELIELFRDIPMWGATAVTKINKLKEAKKEE